MTADPFMDSIYKLVAIKRRKSKNKIQAIVKCKTHKENKYFGNRPPSFKHVSPRNAGRKNRKINKILGR